MGKSYVHIYTFFLIINYKAYIHLQVQNVMENSFFFSMLYYNIKRDFYSDVYTI